MIENKAIFRINKLTFSGSNLLEPVRISLLEPVSCQRERRIVSDVSDVLDVLDVLDVVPLVDFFQTLDRNNKVQRVSVCESQKVQYSVCESHDANHTSMSAVRFTGPQ